MRAPATGLEIDDEGWLHVDLLFWRKHPFKTTLALCALVGAVTWGLTYHGHSMRGQLDHMDAAVTQLHAKSMLLDCSSAVVETIDPVPVRSPQLAHSVLTAHFAGKAIVEIGTRNGDGMQCFARVTKSAVAIEMDKPYCEKLRERAKTLPKGQNYSVACNKYQDYMPDADVYTWWQHPPRLLNEDVLAYLKQLQVQGKVRKHAVAALLFDHGFPKDVDSWFRLQNYATWMQAVKFNEDPNDCRRRSDLSARVCQRAKGVFTVALVPVAAYPG